MLDVSAFVVHHGHNPSQCTGSTVATIMVVLGLLVVPSTAEYLTEDYAWAYAWASLGMAPSETLVPKPEKLKLRLSCTDAESHSGWHTVTPRT